MDAERSRCPTRAIRPHGHPRTCPHLPFLWFMDAATQAQLGFPSGPVRAGPRAMMCCGPRHGCPLGPRAVGLKLASTSESHRVFDNTDCSIPDSGGLGQSPQLALPSSQVIRELTLRTDHGSYFSACVCQIYQPFATGPALEMQQPLVLMGRK